MVPLKTQNGFRIGLEEQMERGKVLKNNEEHIRNKVRRREPKRRIPDQNKHARNLKA